jgi:hypothetical protein
MLTFHETKCAHLSRILWYPQFFKNQNFNLSVFYISLFVVRLPENDLKNIDIFRIFSRIFETAYINVCIFVDVVYQKTIFQIHSKQQGKLFGLSGVRFPTGFFFSPKRSNRFWGPLILSFNYHGSSLPGLKRPWRESNTNFHLVSMLKMTGTTTVPPLDVFKAWARQI